MNFTLYNNTELNELQEKLRSQLNFLAQYTYTPAVGDIIYTLDVKYDDKLANVGVDIISFPTTLLTTISFKTDTFGEYIPGYFSFYEGPVLLKAIEHLIVRYPPPKLLIVDGHGLAHPRQFGLACYVGMKTNLPCIGIAKSTLLPYDCKLNVGKGSKCDIQLDGEIVGVVYRSQQNVKPIFISQGNRVTLDMSINIISQLISKYRLPDTCRRADIATRQISKS